MVYLSKKYIPLLVCVLAISLLVFGVMQFEKNRSAVSPDPCVGKQNQALRNRCYQEQALDILKKQDARAAIEFVMTSVVEHSDAVTVHFIFHILGRASYRKSGELEKALSYIVPFETPYELEDPHGHQSEHFNFMPDGYRHGVLQAFFEENRSKKATNQLAELSCPANWKTTDLKTITNQYKQHKAGQCFHGIGHALMYANANDVLASVRQCSELPQDWMEKWCFYGVFMENMYLFNPNYEAGRPRPFVLKTGMVPLCAQVSETAKGECARFAGNVLCTDPEKESCDFADSFAQCRRIEERFQKPCVWWTSTYVIPMRTGGDAAKVVAACKEAGPDFVATCIRGAVYGIAWGVAGSSAKGETTSFCNLIDDAGLRAECLKTPPEGEVLYPHEL